MKQSLSAIVLAGGKSTRMGQDKALISVDGVPLLKRTCQIALECTPTVTVVTFELEKYSALVPGQCHLLQEQRCSDDPSPPGPLVGFAQGLATVASSWVLLLACDLPYVQADILQQWMRQLPEENSAIALLPSTARGWDPLCGFYHSRCLATLTSFLAQGGRSFQGWLGQVSVQPIVFSSTPEVFQQEQKMLFNCNTPQDLALVTWEEQ